MITINLGNVYSQIQYEQRDIKSLEKILVDNLKVEVPGAKYLWAFKNGSWDGKVNLWEDSFDAQGSSDGIQIRTGLIPRFIELVGKSKLRWYLGIDNRNLPQNAKLQTTSVPLRPYQLEAIRAAFGNSVGAFGWFPRGVIEIAPGGGKTEVAVAMFEINPIPSFFLVHRKDLFLQAKERFEKYGYKIGAIGDSQFSPQQNLNVATLQTLKRIFSEEDSERFKIINKLVIDCQQIFLDEAHLLGANLDKGNEFVEIVNRFESPFRWGLTATAFRRKQFDNLLLEGTAGPSLYYVSTDELSKKGYLIKPKVIMRHVPGTLLASFNWKKGNSNKAKSEYWRDIETRGIKFNEIRTNLIIDEILNGPYPCLVLVKTVEQANFIQQLFKLRCQQDLLFLKGKDSSKVRKKAIQDLRNGSLKTVLATTIFDEGVDIPELSKTIIASGGNSNFKTIQRAGRVLRTSPGKEEAIIIDFTDGHAPLLKKHADARRKVYEELEFKVIVERK